MKTRPFRRLVGGHDATVDPLYNEQSMDGRNQIAQNTPDLARKQGVTNPTSGGTGQGNKYVNNSATTQVPGSAKRLSTGEKVHGRTMRPVSKASMAMKRKLRTAFGQGGTAIPTQGGNRNVSGSGSSMSVSAGAYRGPKGAQGQRAFNAGASWTPNKVGGGKAGHKATPSKTSIRPNMGSMKNV